jgi:protein-disulfide isomerase
MSDDKTSDTSETDEKSGDPGTTDKVGEASKAEEASAGWASNLLFVAAFLATMVGGYFAGQKAIEYFRPVDIQEGDRYKVKLRGDEPQHGPDGALVTIIEFSDFQCPFCGKAEGPLNDAVSSFDDDEVRVIFKHYPLNFHNLATPAARAAWAAHQQGQFWPFADYLFERKANFEDFPAKVKELGMDRDKFVADMESPESLAAVDDDMEAGGMAGVSGTPSFLVNGYPYSGAIDAASWKKIIKHELALAEKLVDDGTPRDGVYAKLMETAKDKRGDGHPVGGKPSERQAAKRKGPNPGLAYRVPIDGRAQKGPDDALVTIVEFADFHCPYCARAARVTDALVKKYEGDVRVIFRQMPLPIHQGADQAAYSVLAAGKQGKFWEAHDKHFDARVRTDGQHQKLAEVLGIDYEQYKADMNSEEVKKLVQEDMALAATMSVTGTPAFFINGKFASGALPMKDFEALVETALEGARKRLGAGIPRAGVYDAIMAEAETSVSK